MWFFASCVTNISCSRQKENVERTAKDPSDGSASEVPSPAPQKPHPAAAKGNVYVTPEKGPISSAIPAIIATPVGKKQPAPVRSPPGDEDDDKEDDDSEDDTLCLDRNGIKKKLQE